MIYTSSQSWIYFNETVFHRVQTFPIGQILQEFTLQCLKLAENDNRGFKLEFEVRSSARKPDRLLAELVKLNCFVKRSFCLVKELNEVGSDLSKVAGDSEPNRQKNRYPYILPCKCKIVKHELQSVWAWGFCLFVCLFSKQTHLFKKTDDHCRVRLSVQNFHPHSDYINANFVPVRLLL